LEALDHERTADLEQTNEQSASEIRERRLAEGTLHQRAEKLAVLGRITQMLASVTDLPQTLRQVCEAVVHLLYAYVLLPPNEEPQLQVQLSCWRFCGKIDRAVCVWQSGGSWCASGQVPKWNLARFAQEVEDP
jgi:hypothetical protein